MDKPSMNNSMNNHIGFIGLGKMGQNMVLNLIEHGVHVSIYNRTSQVTDAFLQEIKKSKQQVPYLREEDMLMGTLTPSKTLQQLIQSLPTPKIVLLMVKAGQPVDDVIAELVNGGIQKGDIIIDGGNSFFEDSKRRHDELAKKGIIYIDCGTSGGLEGARFGACLMLGGEKQHVESLSWLWDVLSGKQTDACGCGDHCSVEHNHGEKGCECGEGGCTEYNDTDHDHQHTKDDAYGDWTYFGESGAGHFVKMVHNGVEYGMNQAIGEGFHLLAEGPYTLNLKDVAANWSRGSVVRGWLIELLERALTVDPRLDRYKGIAGGGQTGQWGIDTSKKYKIPQPILEQSVNARIQSKNKPTFATKVVSALRFEYGGHKEES